MSDLNSVIPGLQNGVAPSMEQVQMAANNLQAQLQALQESSAALRAATAGNGVPISMPTMYNGAADEPGYDIFADVPKATPNLVSTLPSVLTRLFHFIHCHVYNTLQSTNS